MKRKYLFSLAALLSAWCGPYTVPVRAEDPAGVVSPASMSADQFIKQFLGTTVVTISADDQLSAQFVWFTQINASSAPLLVESQEVFRLLDPSVQQAVLSACLGHSMDYFSMVQQAETFLYGSLPEPPVEDFPAPSSDLSSEAENSTANSQTDSETPKKPEPAQDQPDSEPSSSKTSASDPSISSAADSSASLQDSSRPDHSASSDSSLEQPASDSNVLNSSSQTPAEKPVPDSKPQPDAKEETQTDPSGSSSALPDASEASDSSASSEPEADPARQPSVQVGSVYGYGTGHSFWNPAAQPGEGFGSDIPCPIADLRLHPHLIQEEVPADPAQNPEDPEGSKPEQPDGFADPAAEEEPNSKDSPDDLEPSDSSELSGTAPSLERPLLVVEPGAPTHLSGFEKQPAPDPSLVFNKDIRPQGLVFEDHVDPFDPLEQTVLHALAAKAGFDVFEAHPVIYLYENKEMKASSGRILKLSGNQTSLLFQILDADENQADLLFLSDESCSYDQEAGRLNLASAGQMQLSLAADPEKTDALPEEKPAAQDGSIPDSSESQTSESVLSLQNPGVPAAVVQAAQPSEASEFLSRYCYQSGMLIRQANRTNYSQLLSAWPAWIRLTLAARSEVNSYLVSMGSQTYQTLYRQAHRVRLGLPVETVPAASSAPSSGWRPSVPTAAMEDLSFWIGSFWASLEALICLEALRKSRSRLENLGEESAGDY